MSVLKANRGISNMEFYKNAIEIRKVLTNWLLRDYGKKKNVKNALKVLKDIPEIDALEIEVILNKSNNTLVTAYQPWFDDTEKKRIEKLGYNMFHHIVAANSMSNKHEPDKTLRRQHQAEAIACCKEIFAELQFIGEMFNINYNRLTPIIEKIELEIKLLKAWRDSDSKVK